MPTEDHQDYRGDHPPACTCWNCNNARLQRLKTGDRRPIPNYWGIDRKPVKNQPDTSIVVTISQLITGLLGTLIQRSILACISVGICVGFSYVMWKYTAPMISKYITPYFG